MHQQPAKFNCNFKHEDHYKKNCKYKCDYNSNTPPAALAISVLTVAGGFVVHLEVIGPHRGYTTSMDILL